MFKKLLALFTFSVALVQPVYANEVDEFVNRLGKAAELVVTQYKQGEKEPFLVAEKRFKEVLDKTDSTELEIFVSHLFLSEIYMKTEQYKRAKPHLEAVIETYKKDGKKDADLTKEYIQLAIALWDDGNKTKAKHYAGLACDNGNQAGCKLYSELNK